VAEDATVKGVNSFTAYPLQAAMALATLMRSVKDADYDASRMAEAASFLEKRLIAVAELLPHCWKPAVAASVRKAS
jgi:hypothetical protein